MNTKISRRSTLLATALSLFALAFTAPSAPARGADSPAQCVPAGQNQEPGDGDDEVALKYWVKFACNPDTNSTTITVYSGNNPLATFTLTNRCINAEVPLG